MMSKNLFFWIGVFAVSLLVMVRPAAASGIVTASTVYSAYATCPSSVLLGTNYSSPTAACAAVGTFCNIPATIVSPTVPNCRDPAGGWDGYYSGGAAVCPANSTGTTTCTCTDPYTPNAAATACVLPPTIACADGSHSDLTGACVPDLNCASYAKNVADARAYYPLPTGTRTSSVTECFSGCLLTINTYSNGGIDGVGNSQKYIARVGSSCSSVNTYGTDTTAGSASSVPMTSASAVETTGLLTGQNTQNQLGYASGVSAKIKAAGDWAASGVQGSGGSVSDVIAARNLGESVAAAQIGTQTPATAPDVNQWGVAPDAGKVGTQTVTANFTSMVFSTQSGCPADISFTMFGHSYAISFAPACSLMTTLRPLFLLIGGGTAAVILMSVF